MVGGARKIINHGLGFHKAPFKLCTVHRLLPPRLSFEALRSHQEIHRCSLSPWYYVSRRWSRGRENKLAGLLCENWTSPFPLVSNYTAWTPSKLEDSRFVWTDGKPLNYIRDLLDYTLLVISKLAEVDFPPSNIQISPSFLFLFAGQAAFYEGNFEGERILYYILFPFPSTIRVRLAIRSGVRQFLSTFSIVPGNVLGRGTSVLFVRSLSFIRSYENICTLEFASSIWNCK